MQMVIYLYEKQLCRHIRKVIKMTTLNKPTNEKAQAAANTNYNEILGLGFKIEIRSQSNGKSRAYLTDNKTKESWKMILRYP